MKSPGIGFDTQIDNVLFGQSDAEKAAVKEKIELVAANIGRIHRINGSKVYSPSIEGENLFYFLEPLPSWFKITDKTKGNRYYPIQYANIEFYEKEN